MLRSNNMSLTDTQKESLREKLERSEKDLNEQIKNLETDFNFGSDTDHLEEETDESEEKGNLADVKVSLRNRQQKIAKALLKMKSGGYGRCEKCGQDIESEVLNADPESELCRDCKQKS